jgi:hypothetical protein
MNLEVYDESKLRQIVKEAVRDALEEELFKLRLLLAPYISDEEQEEIEKSYGEPSKDVARSLILEE